VRVAGSPSSSLRPKHPPLPPSLPQLWEHRRQQSSGSSFNISSVSIILPVIFGVYSFTCNNSVPSTRSFKTTNQSLSHSHAGLPAVQSRIGLPVISHLGSGGAIPIRIPDRAAQGAAVTRRDPVFGFSAPRACWIQHASSTQHAAQHRDRPDGKGILHRHSPSRDELQPSISDHNRAGPTSPIGGHLCTSGGSGQLRHSESAGRRRLSTRSKSGQA